MESEYRETRSSTALRVTSYNILADGYASRRIYPSIPAEHLRWERREKAIVARLSPLDSDVVCLQEVQASHWPRLAELFSGAGWTGTFAQKGRARIDGCATLVRRDGAALVEHEVLHYNDGAADGAASGHIALLTTLDTGLGRLRIANTHLRWQLPSPAAEDHIGYRQTRELLRHCAEAPSRVFATVICGDTNAPATHPIGDLFTRSGFQDAYAGAPQATCNPNRRKARIDFIWCSERLVPTCTVLPKLDHQTPLPNAEEPSDHLPITATLGVAATAP